MKKVLLQNNFSSLEHIDSLKDLLEDAINDKEISLDFAFCLDEYADKITSYHLIISHPHIEGDCCLPNINNALKENIPVVLIYRSEYPHGKAIRAIAEHHHLETALFTSLDSIEMYKRLIGKYLLEKVKS